MRILSGCLKPHHTFGGVHAPHNKNTAHSQSVIMPPCDEVIIPMSQHIGAPCTPCVKVNDYVYLGQKIGESNAFVSSPIHSSVSGTVSKIIKITTSTGTKCDAVVIKSDGLMAPHPQLQGREVKDREDLLNAIYDSGLVGLGGAGFPAQVKLNIPKDKKADCLIINCAECEPYITADHREAIENSWDVFSGIYAIKDILQIEKVYIGVENNKPDVLEVLSKIADNREYDPDDVVRIVSLKAEYPQGAEKVLIKACTNREVPVGKLPIDVGCIVMNIGSVAFIARYLKSGMPLVSKRITVDGNGIKNPQNIIVPIGTPIKNVIEFCGGYSDDSSKKKILMGGPMMGCAVVSDDEPIQKRNNAILVLSGNDAVLKDETACIRCGRCVSACPMKLVPPAISRAIKLKDFEKAEKLGIMSCMECGCCSFSCPANRFIVQNMRIGKALLKNYQTEKREQNG